jgi:hypothetical protein
VEFPSGALISTEGGPKITIGADIVDESGNHLMNLDHLLDTSVALFEGFIKDHHLAPSRTPQQ